MNAETCGQGKLAAPWTGRVDVQTERRQATRDVVLPPRRTTTRLALGIKSVTLARYLTSEARSLRLFLCPWARSASFTRRRCFLPCTTTASDMSHRPPTSLSHVLGASVDFSTLFLRSPCSSDRANARTVLPQLSPHPQLIFRRVRRRHPGGGGPCEQS